MVRASAKSISDWSEAVIQRKRSKSSTLASISNPPTNIWRSRISWRIALSLFLTILVVQGGIIIFNFKQQETTYLNDLREVGRSIISPAIGNVTNMFASPISQDLAERISSTTAVKGIAIYSMDLRLLGSYGEPVSMIMLDQDSLNRSYRSIDGSTYEVVYRASDLRRPYVAVVRLDSNYIGPALLDYIKQTLAIMLLMSAFVTVVLMISLSKWLLEPILFMRDNLMAAAENPENPVIKESPYDEQDEIGGAITLTQNLILQNAENISQIKSAAEDKIHKLAYYDQLTGLPNRIQFLQKLTDQARKANDDDSRAKRFAVIAMDLDHFKDINDSMGHNVGDAILRGVGKRLRAALPDSAVVARSGEDEFAITMPLSTDINSARDVADKVVKVIRSEPFKVFNETFQIRASIGVSTFPDDGIDPDQVLKNADIALNRAKEEGRDTIKEYSEDFDRAVQQRFQLLRDLRDAMEAKELQLYFQPQFDLNSGKIIGAEALLRWFKKDNSKAGGQFISPAEFVPIAEQSGLIVPIGEWVLRHSCEVAAKWQAEGQDIRVAVNVSGAQFYQSDLVEYVSKCLKNSGLKPQNLELEVTESVFMDDIQQTIETLQQLHALGVELAIDDFGTGYSSLSYLRQFPIDRLKIDQSFIRNALNNADDAAIARTIVRLGHSLNLKVIAEGVETKEHEAFLLEEKCDEVQGFRYSRPIPLEEFNKFATSYKGNLSVFDK
ncbi:MAG: bifunctional diguanylate cyclase/phosphodiesterase [Micavibrio aeruginosavorus]|uniref:Bifunctional diguanylate cyclase/phosphodiesterase n=1 Tax=Micavibrio aeruginosavorus TaxID=349221 RepID=A0A2W5N018_9BACT|nr:MAG: bifunctional diguanylate cyclase/phosphodiesterase [Micavibrio aeruginosavorus]